MDRAGTFGGIAQTIAGHPLDTVKVRLQTQVTVPGQLPQFAGMVDCFRKTVKGEGFFGLYKGAASPMAGAMAMNAALFFSYGQSKHIVTHFAGKVWPLILVFVASLLRFACCCDVCCSRETAS